MVLQNINKKYKGRRFPGLVTPEGLGGYLITGVRVAGSQSDKQPQVLGE